MTFDKKKIYIISSIIFVALLVALFIPFGTGRIVGAVVLIPATILACMFIKKRNALSINTKEIISWRNCSTIRKNFRNKWF